MDGHRDKGILNEHSQLEDELSEVLRFFDLGRLDRYRRAGGFANENYFVSAESGQYVVKFLRERSVSDVLSELPYLERVAEYGFPAVPYLQAHGQCVFEQEGFAAVAMKQIDAEPPDRKITSVVMAEALAKLHSVPHTGLKRRTGFLSGDFIAKSIESLVLQVPGEDLKPYIEAQDRLAGFIGSLETKETSIIHCDFTPNNCLFRSNRLVGVIDWEEVTVGYPLLDLANLMLSTCFVESKFDRDLLNEIAASYERSRKNGALDYERLSNALRMAGLCFSLWVYLRWGVGSDDPFIVRSRQFYWEQGLEDLELTPFVDG